MRHKQILGLAWVGYRCLAGEVSAHVKSRRPIDECLAFQERQSGGGCVACVGIERGLNPVGQVAAANHSLQRS